MADEIRIPVRGDSDIVPARAEARALAIRLGFARVDATLIATAISEIARNIILHAREGTIVMSPSIERDRYGVVVVAEDEGPGIRDVAALLEQVGADRGNTGLGLTGARRLMDEFSIDSAFGRGTTVRMVKWRRRDELERLREQRQRRNGDRP